MIPSQIGGKRYGTGGFGIVYGDPRVPCINENPYDNMTDLSNQVSKHFKRSNTGKVEIDKINRFLDALTPEEQEELKKHVLLPVKSCTMDISFQDFYPDIYTKEWSENSSIPVVDSTMLVYPKASQDLFQIVHGKMNTPEDFKQILLNLNNVLQGIKLIRQKGYVHRDVKMENIMETSDNHLVLIDMADVTKQDDISGTPSIPVTNPYYIWPSCVFFLMKNKPITYQMFLKYVAGVNVDERGKVTLKNHYTGEMMYKIGFYKRFLDSIGKNYSILLDPSRLAQVIYKKLLSSMYLDTPVYDDELHMMDTLFYDNRTDHYRSNIYMIYYITKLITPSKVPEYPVEIYHRMFTRYLKKYNDIPDKYTSINKIIDIYSFGTMIFIILQIALAKGLITRDNAWLFDNAFSIADICTTEDILLQDDKIDTILSSYIEFLTDTGEDESTVTPASRTTNRTKRRVRKDKKSNTRSKTNRKKSKTRRVRG